jgi:hypothetical protein
VDPSNDNAILIDPPLPSAPLENYIVDIGKYPDSTDIEDQALFKSIFVYLNNQVTVVSGLSSTQFIIDNADLSKLAVGYQVKIHDDTYTKNSVLTKITDITGTTITVDTALGFTPLLGDKIELLGYPDGGKPYLYL